MFSHWHGSGNFHWVSDVNVPVQKSRAWYLRLQARDLLRLRWSGCNQSASGHHNPWTS